jgi:hypothetical protein
LSSACWHPERDWYPERDIHGAKSHLPLIRARETLRMTLSNLRPATPAHLALVGAAVWLIGTLFHVAAGVLVPVGLALLLLAALGWLVRPRTRTTYWRGRPVELTDDAPTLGHRLYKALFRR